MGRIERVDSEIKKQLSSVLADGVKDPRVSGMISVMSVRTDTELDQAKVYARSGCGIKQRCRLYPRAHSGKNKVARYAFAQVLL